MHSLALQALTGDRGLWVLRHTGPAASPTPAQTSWLKTSLKTHGVWETEDEFVLTTIALQLLKFSVLSVEFNGD